MPETPKISADRRHAPSYAVVMHGWPKVLFYVGAVFVAIAAFCLIQLLLNPFRGPGDDVWTATGIAIGVTGLLFMSTGTVMKRGL